MSAQPDRFGGPEQGPVTFAPDLRVSASWRSIEDPTRRGQFLPWVVESFCGRYTITWTSTPGEDDSRVFLGWRRHPLVNGRRAAPSLIGRWPTAREARLALAEHSEANP